MTLSTGQFDTTEIFYPDSEDKPKKYQKMGVLEYFQYDPTGDYLKQQLKSSRLIGNHYQPIAANLLPNSVVSIYSEVLGLELRLLEGEIRFYDPQTEKRLLSHLETEQARQQAEQALQQEAQARRDAIPRLIGLGLSTEQVAEALDLSVGEVRQSQE